MTRMILRCILSLSVIVASVSCLSDNDHNSTTVSNGVNTFSDHGDPDLVCRPTRWMDILAFFALNYIAHAATLKSLPGEKASSMILNISAALFFPTSGIFRGINTLWSCAMLADSDLEVAARAEALCTVVVWPPTSTENEQRRFSYTNLRPVPSLFETSVHGRYQLPYGYRLVRVHADAKFENDIPHQSPWWRSLFKVFKSADHHTAMISCSYNVVKILVALMQLLYATAELYETRGEQIKWYGFSAFGLTVAPYAWMSFVNLCANLMCPDYPALYIVASEALDKVQEELRIANQPLIDGVVGRLTKASEQQLIIEVEKTTSILRLRNGLPTPRKAQNFLRFVAISGIGATVPVVVIGSLSQFSSGSHSTGSQRVVIGLWLLYGICLGILEPLLRRAFEDRPFVNIWVKNRRTKVARIWVAATFIFGAIAVYGMIVVGRMIIAYGVCIAVA